MSLHLSTSYVCESIVAACAGGVLSLLGISLAKFFVLRQQRTTRSPH